MGTLTMVNKPAQRVGSDMALSVTALVAEVMATVQLQIKPWHAYACRVIALPTDGRALLIKMLGDDLRKMRADNAAIHAELGKDGKPNPTKDETKAAAKLVASATVNVARLSTIAKAWNSGATLEGLLDFATGRGGKPTSINEIGFIVIYNYAQTFSKSKAGRTPDTWLVKLGKFLEKNPPAEDDADALEQYNAIVAVYNAESAKVKAVI